MSLDFLHVWHACVFLITSLFIYHGGCLTEPRAFDDLAGWLSLGVPVSASFEAGIPRQATGFLCGCWNPNSSPHAWEASTLFTESFPQAELTF